MSDLTHRARKILTAVVQEYLHTGDAVGSRTVTRRYGIDLSPATVRNVMADLEELGLLKQPHTSAGRVPTTHGLRFFIDSLLKVRSLPHGELLAVLVTEGGQVENKLLKVDVPSRDPAFLERVNNYLNEKIAGKT